MKSIFITIVILVLSLVVCNGQNDTTFYGNWETGLVYGDYSHNWRAVQREETNRFTVVLSDSAREGDYYARIEVRDNDDVLEEDNNSSRSEVVGMRDDNNDYIWESESTGTQTYSFSVNFDPTWQNIRPFSEGGWGIFVQLHGPDAQPWSPAWAFSATDSIHFNMHVGDISLGIINTEYDLSEGHMNIGDWIDFIITVDYKKDATGSVNIQRRDEGESEFIEVLNITDTPTLQWSTDVDGGNVGVHYMKHGLYRQDTTFTSILYLDGFVRYTESEPVQPSSTASHVMKSGSVFLKIDGKLVY